MLGHLSLVLIVASSALSAGIAGTVAWKYQAARYEQEKAELYASATAAIRQTELRYADQVRKAQDQSKGRERAARLDADRARLVADGLRHDLQRAVRSAEDSPTSCPDRAAAIADVLVDVERAGRDLAAACDRHVNDLRTLTEAWPR